MRHTLLFVEVVLDELLDKGLRMSIVLTRGRSIVDGSRYIGRESLIAIWMLLRRVMNICRCVLARAFKRY